MNLNESVDVIFDRVVAIRRQIHRHPEFGFAEFKTAELICDELNRLHIPYTAHVAKTGVVGLIEADKAKKTLLIRADMDALPLQEETDCPYRSQRDGYMHACGHDAHVAIVLGTAMLLKQLQPQLACNVKLVFQPNEENEGGAEPMIEAGVLENPHVDAAVGGHVMNNVPVGKILIKYGEMMAAPDDFVLKIHGQSGHGAYPHQCVNPITVGNAILNAWDSLSVQGITPLEKHVISVCMFQAGTCSNIIPETAEIIGTVRTFNETVRQELAQKMDQLAVTVGKAYGADCRFTYNFRYPPLVNDNDMTAAFRAAAETVLGTDNVLEGSEPSMAGEDFSYFARCVPATFIHYGVGNPNIGAVQPLHSTKFTIDENGMKAGILALTQFALQFGRDE